jgi:hypothetical protein
MLDFNTYLLKSGVEHGGHTSLDATASSDLGHVHEGAEF